jgi:chaperonin GroEL
VEEGVVPGGGVAYIRAIHVLDKLKGSEDFMAGVKIVRRALEEPARQIANNCGVEGSVVVERIKGEKGAVGFNAKLEKYEDLIKAGILDPAKVTRTALQNAASAAGTLLTTEAMIFELPEEKKDMPPMPGGMGGDMY